MRVAVIAACLFGCAAPSAAPDAGARDAGIVSQLDAGSDLDAGGVCTSDIVGAVRFPNGIHAVSGARVYRLLGGEPIYTGQCGQCVEAESVYTTSGADGSFALSGVFAGHYRLAIEKGGFRRIVEVDVPPCSTVVLDEEATRLPRNRTEGEIPRIAVGTGANDSMQGVLARMGLGEIDASGRLVPGTEQFDLYDGTMTRRSPTLAELLHDADRLNEYATLFINCGSTDEMMLVRESIVTDNLRAFVYAGGRLYVTDQAYDYVEQTLPPYLAFENPSPVAPSGLLDSPEPIDAAQLGGAMPLVRGEILDAPLHDWLDALNLLDGDRVDIEGWFGQWAVMHEVHPTRARAWVAGDVWWSTDEVGAVRPLTATFEYGCGRVLYSSYHTSAVSGAELGPQELILAYLALEMNMCIVDPPPI